MSRKEEIKLLQERILKLRKECSHKEVEKIPRADTGNWCPQDDCYWYECLCKECGKVWDEEPL